MTPFRTLKRQVIELKDSWSPQLKQVAVEMGLMGAHTNYTRFIILGRSRSGSNFLRGLLNAHSQILTFEEMFKDSQQIGWGLPNYPQSGPTLARYQNDVSQFIEKDLFKKMPGKVKAVGFKIFYYHAYGSNQEPIWDYLKSDKNVHVLHIKRKNILKTHYSKKRAELTDQWINLTGVRQAAPVISLDYDECLNDFEQTKTWESDYKKIFADHPYFEIIYEDLSKNYEHAMPLIQDFLSVDRENVLPQTYKQSVRPLSESIANYFELKAKFSGTPWEEFFNE